MFLPILLILLFCTQINIFKSTMRSYDTNLIDATIYKIGSSIAKYKQSRAMPRNLRGFKPRWNQVVKRDEEKGSISIYTPWYFKPKVAYTIAAICLCATIAYFAQDYPWGHLLNVPMAMGMTNWVDGNTSATPTANDMDGGGTDLATGDTVNITKALVIDKSVGCGNLTVTTLTIDADKVFTLDAGSTATATVGCVVAGTLTPGNATLNFSHAAGWGLSVVVGATFTVGSGTHTFSSAVFNGATAAAFTSGNMIITGKNTASLYFGNYCAPAHSNGTITFTRADAQTLGDAVNFAHTFYNVVINNAACALTYYGTTQFNLTVANNLTITAGSFTTWDGTTSASLTVTNATSITGTLDCKASTVNLNGGINVAFGASFTNAASSTINIRTNSKIEVALTVNGAFNVVIGTLIYTSIDIANGGSVSVTSGAHITPIGGGFSYDNYVLGGSTYPTITLNGNDPAPWAIIQHCTLAGTLDPDRTRIEDCKASYYVMTSVMQSRVRTASVNKAQVFRSEM